MRWLNGDRGARVAADDRGLAYGDGLFESIALIDGRPRLLDYHLDRLEAGCRALRLAGVSRADVRRRLLGAAAARPSADWLKLIVTRGSGTRGYAAPRHPDPVGIVTTGALGPAPARWRARLCATPLPDAGALAGIKHLNRLPQVMARMELGPDEHEGLMRDAAGDIACGIMSNVFIVTGQRVVTPDLARAGVAGTMRRFVRDTLPVTTGRVRPDALLRANEVFVTNALRGVVSLSHVAGRALPADTPVADGLRDALAARNAR